MNEKRTRELTIPDVANADARVLSLLWALAKAGVHIRPCRCKNPELTNKPCGIASPAGRVAQDCSYQGEFNFTARISR